MLLEDRGETLERILWGAALALESGSVVADGRQEPIERYMKRVQAALRRRRRQERASRIRLLLTNPAGTQKKVA